LTLPAAGNHGFWLNGERWEAPNFENADDFVARLVRPNFLVQDPLVTEALQGDSMRKENVRTVQRRFVNATGLTRKAILVTERAHAAAIMLRNGVSINDTVAALGFSDQSHLTRSLRRLIGLTPTQLGSKTNPVQLSFIPEPEPRAFKERAEC